MIRSLEPSTFIDTHQHCLGIANEERQADAKADVLEGYIAAEEKREQQVHGMMILPSELVEPT